MVIIDGSVNARMARIIDNPAFILSIFIEILKNIYTI
jgi:hypothetical protein